MIAYLIIGFITVMFIIGNTIEDGIAGLFNSIVIIAIIALGISIPPLGVALLILFLLA